MRKTEEIRDALRLMPTTPGVYQFLDSEGTVIYVGKAVNLRRRVSSYFVDSSKHTPKVRALVAKVSEIRHIDTASEQDALLLENSLIKSLKPRYNILLKDDKTYPWIVIRNEPFPRVESTRRMVRDGSLYFGPYSSGLTQKSMLEFIRSVYQIRTCRLDLSPERIARGSYKVCLQYHIGNCKGPCVGLQDEDDYRNTVDMIRRNLRGDIRQTREYLTERMREASESLRFEIAGQYKNRLDLLENYASKSVIVSDYLGDVDVFSLFQDGDYSYINFVRVVSGTVTRSLTVQILCGAEEEPSVILTGAIHRICDQLDISLAHEVVVPLLPCLEEFDGVTFTVPQRGDKARLLEFSDRGARLYHMERMRNMEIKNPERHKEKVMSDLQRELHLDRPPRHIECFDNSNLQGTYPVASCVVFRDGKPSRREYRHFHIKTVVGPDDFASMREIITRRYSRLLSENAELPDLIVVDGGKGQLSSAYAVLQELNLDGRIPIIGLAKRIEEVYFPNDPLPYYLERTGDALRVIMHIRDEAHRFGITFHRDRRSAGFIRSALDGIDGIGEVTVTRLMERFRTVKAVRSASQEDLSAVIGQAKASRVYEHLHGK